MSTCNLAVQPRRSGLFQLDLATGSLEEVDVGCADGLVVSGVGICADESRIYHLSITAQGFATCLSVLDRESLELLAVQTLPEVLDGHSIARLGDDLFVVSTGRDEIVAYEMQESRATNPRVVWSPTGSRADTHHLNSVAVADGEVVCSGFGWKEHDSWRTAKNGYVYNLTRGETTLEGLQQPHSTAWWKGRLYYCNSQQGTVNADGEVVTRVPGYSRGLAFASDGTMYAASSVSRHPAPGADAAFGNPDDPGPLTGRCAILEYLQDEERASREMSVGQALEIYDLYLR